MEHKAHQSKVTGDTRINTPYVRFPLPWIPRRLHDPPTHRLKTENAMNNSKQFFWKPQMIHQFDDAERRSLHGPMHHYSSLDALLSIFESKSLRATAVQYLNDASEGELGFSLIRDMALAQEKTTNGIQKQFLQFFIEWIDSRYILNASVFVLCFSEAADQLSQWRGYTPHGRGVSIGIDIALLVERMQQIGSGWTFQNCRYEEGSKNAWAKAILSRLCQHAGESLTNLSLVEHFTNVMSRNASELMQTAALMKNKGFKEEREVRLISPAFKLDDPRVLYRAGRSTLIPYIEFPLVPHPTDSLSSVDIWIGPGPTQKLSHSAIVNAVIRYKFARSANFHSSAIPYREL